MKKTFTVYIEEKRSKTIEINAVTEDEALDMVESLYRSGDIRLDEDDFEDVEFMCQEDLIEQENYDE